MNSTLTNQDHPAMNPWLSQVAVIDAIEQEIESVATYQMRLISADIAERYRFEPGQFNMLYIPSSGESAISLSGSPEDNGNRLYHTIRFVGRVTDSIAKLQVGDQIGIRGPFGTPWPLAKCLGQDVILIAGGIGLAPLRPAIYHLLRHRSEYSRLVLLYGARTPELLLYMQELDGWQRQGLEVYITVDRAEMNWQGQVGVVPLLLDRLPNLRPLLSQVLICGPEVMMHCSALSAIMRGIPETAIWLSVERNMQCAIGLCGHCQVGPVFVCRDGPVFRYDRIRNLMKVRDI